MTKVVLNEKNKESLGESKTLKEEYHKFFGEYLERYDWQSPLKSYGLAYILQRTNNFMYWLIIFPQQHDFCQVTVNLYTKDETGKIEHHSLSDIYFNFSTNQKSLSILLDILAQYVASQCSVFPPMKVNLLKEIMPH